MIEGFGNFQETIFEKKEQKISIGIFFHRFQVSPVTGPGEP